jgi:hypothetical protein
MLTKNASSVELYGEFSRREPKNTTKQSASLRDAVTVRQPGLCYPTFDQGKAGPSRGREIMARIEEPPSARSRSQKKKTLSQSGGMLFRLHGQSRTATTSYAGGAWP